MYAPLPPKFSVSSCKTNNRTYETSHLLLEACELLLEAKNYLQNAIEEFNNVFSEKDELDLRNFAIFKEETIVSRPYYYNIKNHKQKLCMMPSFVTYITLLITEPLALSII